MKRLIRIELLKLHTIRATYGLALAAAGITALFASLEASRGGRSGTTPIYTVAGLSTVSTATGVVMVLAAVLGVIAASGEYRHTTATLTYLATPNRSRVLAAKSIAAAIAGFAYGIIAALVATATALIFVAAHGYHDTLGAGTFAAHILGAGLGAALLAAVGVAVGSLIRAQIAAVVGVLVWCMIIESILGGSFAAIRPYLPYTAASTLAGAKLGAAAFGPSYSVSGQQALPFIAAAGLLAAMAALLALIAARTTLRHDIT
jgi:ABC-2 type transport system permease protein